MSGLPPSWGLPALEELGLPSTPNVDPSKYPNEIFELYSVPSYTNRNPETIEGSEIKSTKQAVEPGDVLLCKIVPHLNRVWVVGDRGNYRQIASGEWIVVRSPLCNPYYLRYALSESGFRSKFMETVSGVGGSLLRARPQLVAKIDIPLPSLSEQYRIVAKLDSLFIHIRRAREELNKIPRLIEHYKQAILAAAFRGDLTADLREEHSIESGWEETSLGAVLDDIRYGTSKKCDYKPEDVPVLRIPNITEDGILLADVKFASFTQDERDKLALKSGDILIIRSNGSLGLVGRAALVTETEIDCVFAGYLMRLRLNLEVEPRFVLYFLREPGTRRQIEMLAKSTSGVNNINSQEVKSLPFRKPSIVEQREIIRHLDIAFDHIACLSKELGRATAMIEHLDQANLHKAFRGELVPQDPNDEPASALLDRIRAERDGQSNSKRSYRKNYIEEDVSVV